MQKGLSIFLLIIMMLFGYNGDFKDAIVDKTHEENESEKELEFLGIELEYRRNKCVYIKKVYDQYIDKGDRYIQGDRVIKWGEDYIVDKLKEVAKTIPVKDEYIRLNMAARIITIRDEDENEQFQRIKFENFIDGYKELRWKKFDGTYDYAEAVKSKGKKILLNENGTPSSEELYRNYRIAGDNLIYYFQEKYIIKTAVIKPRDLKNWTGNEFDEMIEDIYSKKPYAIILDLCGFVSIHDDNMDIFVDKIMKISDDKVLPIVINKNSITDGAAIELMRRLDEAGIKIVVDGDMSKFFNKNWDIFITEDEKNKRYKANEYESWNIFRKLIIEKSAEKDWDEEIIINYKDYTLNPNTLINIEMREHPYELLITTNNARYSHLKLDNLNDSEIVKRCYGIMTLCDDTMRFVLSLENAVEWELTEKYNPYGHIIKLKLIESEKEDEGYVILTNEFFGERTASLEDIIEDSKLVEIGGKDYLQVGYFENESECLKRIQELRKEYEEDSEWLSFSYKKFKDIEY